MRKNRRNSGFTMVELITAVAIIAVLAAVAFITVQTYQRRMAQTEMDSIAKEIFVAAQNHLTMAKTQNYLGITESLYGEKEKEESIVNKKVYHFLKSNNETSFSGMSELMLPFGSIDETVRSGNFIIRYQPDTAIVLDVFYTTPNGRYSAKLPIDNDEPLYNKLLSARGSDKSQRNNYEEGKLFGWWGTTGDDETGANIAIGAWLEQPSIEIENAEKLVVRVTDKNDPNNSGYTLKLIITGLNAEDKEYENSAKVAYTLKPDNETNNYRVTYDGSSYSVVLDDITKNSDSNNYHFQNINNVYNAGTVFKGAEKNTKLFVPGQNISIQAISYNNSKLSNIAKSDIEITNSLFERINNPNGFSEFTAYVNNIRHLENLEEIISGIVYLPESGYVQDPNSAEDNSSISNSEGGDSSNTNTSTDDGDSSSTITNTNDGDLSKNDSENDDTSTVSSGLSQSYLHLNMRTKSHIYHGIRGTSSN